MLVAVDIIQNPNGAASDPYDRWQNTSGLMHFVKCQAVPRADHTNGAYFEIPKHPSKCELHLHVQYLFATINLNFSSGSQGKPL